MKSLAVCGLLLFVSSGLFAQRHGGVGNTIGTNAGFGNVVFPAGKPVINTPFTLTNPHSAQILGNVVAGRPPYTGVNGGRRSFQSGGGVVYIPYAYPVFAGGYYGGYGDPSAQQQQPNVVVVYPGQQQPQAPSVIINQVPPGAAPPDIPRSQMQEYGPQAPANYQPGNSDSTQQQESTYYLLAFKDHSVYSAVGYWVDGDTLHYITTGNIHNQVSVSLVDRDLTEQLNKGRNVQVRLPAPASR